MCVRHLSPAAVPRAELEEAVRLTTHWAERQRGEERAPGQLLFGISQGAADPELRRRSIEEIAALDFDGHALGGLAVGGTSGAMFDATAWAAPLLPDGKPRYFMGIGDTEGILRVIGAGIDMFDCVLPTRTARTGSALGGNAESAQRPLRRRASRSRRAALCPACTRFSRAYVRHLVNQEEILGLRLLEPASSPFPTRTDRGRAGGDGTR